VTARIDFPLDIPNVAWYLFLCNSQRSDFVSAEKSEVLQGTLDMMILKTLHALGPLHGFGIARRIEQVSEDVLTLNEGTVYTSLLRLQKQGWIESAWGASENNRRARFYSITKQGRKQLAVETENWERISGVIGRVLRMEAQK
jgi:transcriptional regulator